MLLSRSDGFCEAQFLGCSRGVVEIVDDGTIALHPISGKVKSVDSCVAEWSYERRDDQLSDETLYWRRADDGAGAALILRSPDTHDTLFRTRAEFTSAT